MAGLREDLPGEEKAKAAETSGNQVNTLIFECDRRRFLVFQRLLPPQDLPRALFVFDQRTQSGGWPAGLLFLQEPAQFLGRRMRRDEDELADEPGVLQRRRLEQPRQTRKQRLFLMFANDDLRERLAGGLAAENGLYPFKARERVLAVALRNVLLPLCLQR